MAAVALTVTAASVLLGRAAASQDDLPAAPQPAAVAVAPASRDEAGAVAAAVEYLSIYGSEVMFYAPARRAALSEIISDERREAVLQETDRAYALAARTLGVDASGQSPLGTLVARLVPVGVDVVDLEPSRATVSVWATSLLGVSGPGSTVPVQESWSTERVELVWEDDRWLWWDVTHADGPAPVGSTQVPADAAALLDTHRSHVGVTGD